MSKVLRYLSIVLSCVLAGIVGVIAYFFILWGNANSFPTEIAPREQEYVDSLQRACSCEVGYARRADFKPGYDPTLYMMMEFRGKLAEGVPVDSSATAEYMRNVVRSVWTIVEHRDRYERVQLQAFRTDTAGRKGYVFTDWIERGDVFEFSFRHWRDPEVHMVNGRPDRTLSW